VIFLKENYQKKLDEIIAYNQRNNSIPSLLLHSCCAPCSSYCIEYLSQYFDITLYFYNPNISYKEEFTKRADELTRLINSMPLTRKVNLVIEHFNPNEFYEIAKGLEKEPERGARCEKCFYLRLKQTAQYAKSYNYDYFSTTLSISPHKDAQLLNKLGEKISSIYNVNYLFSDFKKKNGYKRSIELSNEYDLYRQNYCGCIYSKQASEENNKKENV
jgi:predicted adenine nucleotide alpha hydrolase (AANH) superfamily ATPase